MIGKKILTAIFAWCLSGILWVSAAPSVALLAESEFPPFSYLSSEQQAEGIAVRVVNELLRRAKVNAPTELQPWVRAYKTALERPNVGLYPIKRTFSRNQQFQWIGVVAPYPMSVYAVDPKLKKTVHNLSTSAPLRVGAVNQGYVENVLLHLGFRKEKNIFSVTDYPQNVKKLLSNRIDLLPISDYSMDYILHQFHEIGPLERQPYRLMDFTPDRYPVLFLAMNRKSDPTLVKRLQLTLKQMHEDGSYDAIVAGYFQQHPYIKRVY